MEISDQLFEEIVEALVHAHKKLGEVNNFCKEVKTVAGIDTDNLCSRTDEVTEIVHLALKKVEKFNV